MFDAWSYHPIEIRARGGLAEVRMDGVVIAAGLAAPDAPARLGLYALGPATFDAVSVTIARPE